MVDDNNNTNCDEGNTEPTRRGVLTTFGAAAGALFATSGVASAQSTSSSLISVNPDPPEVGTETTFTSDHSSASSLYWYIRRPDGSYETGSGQDFTVTFEDAGNYTATLFVMAGRNPRGKNYMRFIEGGTIEEAEAIEDPVATIEYSPQEPVFNPITFDASGSSASGGSIDSYDWYLSKGSENSDEELFDDTPSATGQTYEESFSVGDTWSVGLEITDQAGNTDRDSVTVTPVDDGPIANIEYAPEDPAFNPITFDASGSRTVEEIRSYDWYLKKEGSSNDERPLFDGSPSTTGTTYEESFVPGDTWSIGLEVTNSEGDTGRDSVTVTPVEKKPVANIEYSPQDPVFNPVTFDGSASTRPGGTVESYRWEVKNMDRSPDRDLFDGSTSRTGQTFEESFSSGDTWAVGLEVTGSGGNTDRARTTFTAAEKEEVEVHLYANQETYDGTGAQEWLDVAKSSVDETLGSLQRHGAIQSYNVHTIDEHPQLANGGSNDPTTGAWGSYLGEKYDGSDADKKGVVHVLLADRAGGRALGSHWQNNDDEPARIVTPVPDDIHNEVRVSHEVLHGLIDSERPEVKWLTGDLGKNTANEHRLATYKSDYPESSTTVTRSWVYDEYGPETSGMYATPMVTGSGNPTANGRCSSDVESSSDEDFGYTLSPSDCTVDAVGLSNPNVDYDDPLQYEEKPVANIDYSPQNPTFNPVTFDASGSRTIDGEIESYRWEVKNMERSPDRDLFDGSTNHTEQTFEESFSTGDTWMVGVEVTDSAGNTARETVTFTPVDPEPNANIEYSPQDPTFNPVTFDASGSSTPDGEIESYRWEVRNDDRSPDRELFNGSPNGIEPTFEESFSTGDTWTVGVEVTDSNGRTARETVTFTPVEPEPEANIEYSPKNPVYNPITFDASGSSTPDGEIESYVWEVRNDDRSPDRDLFNGSPNGTEVTFEESLSTGDTWSVGVEVTDSNGRTARDRITVTPVDNS